MQHDCSNRRGLCRQAAVFITRRLDINCLYRPHGAFGGRVRRSRTTRGWSLTNPPSRPRGAMMLRASRCTTAMSAVESGAIGREQSPAVRHRSISNASVVGWCNRPTKHALRDASIWKMCILWCLRNRSRDSGNCVEKDALCDSLLGWTTPEGLTTVLAHTISTNQFDYSVFCVLQASEVDHRPCGTCCVFLFQVCSVEAVATEHTLHPQSWIMRCQSLLIAAAGVFASTSFAQQCSSVRREARSCSCCCR